MWLHRIQHIENALFTVAGVGSGFDTDEGHTDLLSQMFMPQGIRFEHHIACSVVAVGAEYNGLILRTLQILCKIVMSAAVIKHHTAGIVVQYPDILFHT